MSPDSYDRSQESSLHNLLAFHKCRLCKSGQGSDAVPCPGTAELGPRCEIITWPALCCLKVALQKVGPRWAATAFLLIVCLVWFSLSSGNARILLKKKREGENMQK